MTDDYFRNGRVVYVLDADGETHLAVWRGVVVMTPLGCHATDLDLSTQTADMPTNGAMLCSACFPPAGIQGHGRTETKA